QQQLRSLTGEALKSQYFETLDSHLQQQIDQAEEKQLTDFATASRKLRKHLHLLCHQKHPFASPYYWSAFICQGLR
ncbi:MAG: hypothetical protein ACOC04_06625, partial [Halothece sp.]